MKHENLKKKDIIKVIEIEKETLEDLIREYEEDEKLAKHFKIQLESMERLIDRIEWLNRDVD